MYHTIEDFEDLIDENLPDNTLQEIDAAAAAEVASVFIDSFATRNSPVPSYPFKLIYSDLDSSLEVVLPHNLGATTVKVILYNRDKIKLGKSYFDASPVDEDNLSLRIFSGIPVNEVYTGLIYMIS